MTRIIKRYSRDLKHGCNSRTGHYLHNGSAIWSAFLISADRDARLSDKLNYDYIRTTYGKWPSPIRPLKGSMRTCGRPFSSCGTRGKPWVGRRCTPTSRRMRFSCKGRKESRIRPGLRKPPEWWTPKAGLPGSTCV